MNCPLSLINSYLIGPRHTGMLRIGGEDRKISEINYSKKLNYSYLNFFPKFLVEHLLDIRDILPVLLEHVLAAVDELVVR